MATGEPVYALEFSVANIGSDAQHGGVNIPRFSFTSNETLGFAYYER